MVYIVGERLEFAGFGFLDGFDNDAWSTAAHASLTLHERQHGLIRAMNVLYSAKNRSLIVITCFCWIERSAGLHDGRKTSSYRSNGASKS